MDKVRFCFCDKKEQGLATLVSKVNVKNSNSDDISKKPNFSNVEVVRVPTRFDVNSTNKGCFIKSIYRYNEVTLYINKKYLDIPLLTKYIGYIENQGSQLSGIFVTRNYSNQTQKIYFYCADKFSKSTMDLNQFFIDLFKEMNEYDKVSITCSFPEDKELKADFNNLLVIEDVRSCKVIKELSYQIKLLFAFSGIYNDIDISKNGLVFDVITDTTKYSTYNDVFYGIYSKKNSFSKINR